MKLRWKNFERALSARVEEYDARAKMSFWRRLLHLLEASPDIPFWVARGMGSLFFGFFILVLLASDASRNHPKAWMAGASLWGLTLAACTALWARSPGQVDPIYRALWLLPVPADEILNHLLRRLMQAAVWLFCELLLVYGLVAALAKQHVSYWAATLICVTLQVALALAVVLALIARRFPTWRSRPNAILSILLFEALIALALFNEPLFVGCVYICNPLGWAYALFMEGWVAGHPQALWALVPILALFTTVPGSIRAVRKLNHDGALSRTYTPRRILFLLETEKPEVEPETIGVKSAKEMIHQWLQPLGLNKMGVLEKRIHAVLPPRDQVIADMLVYRHPPWSKQFSSLLVCFFLFIMANSLLPIWSLPDVVGAIVNFDRTAACILAAWVVSIILFSMMCVRALGLFFWCSWPEWSTTTLGTKPYPTHRGFRLLPASVLETTKVIAKINTLIFLLLLPLTFIFSFSPTCQMVMKPALQAPAFLPKCLLLLWSISLLAASGILMPSFNDGWKYWSGLLSRSLAFLGLLTVGWGLLSSRRLLLDCAVAAALIILTLAWLAFCAAKYRKGAFAT